MKKLLLIGKSGQIGSNLAELCGDCNSPSSKELDLSKPETIYPKLKTFSPEIIINAAAYTSVDLAEDEKELCDKINHLSVAEIAKYCAENNTFLIHYSTDYVFDGTGEKEFKEDNTANLKPRNHYGATKLAGEEAIRESGCKYLILRTSWVYNHSEKNFVKTILKLASEREELKIIDDQIGSPSYAKDLAEATVRMLSDLKTGTYHLVPQEQISWYKFAKMIVEEAKIQGFPIKVEKITPITTADYPTKASRPLNSRLSTKKLLNDYGIILPSISSSLKNCLQKMES